jgi:hypothetical protein
VSEVSVSQFAIIAMSLVMGWILDDGVANLLLKKHEKGVKIRFFGARWLSRKKAIVVAFIQIIVAMVFGYFIQDFLTGLLVKAFAYIVPIGMLTIATLYPYILSGLPFKIKFKHLVPSLILTGLAFLLFLGIWYFTN